MKESTTLELRREADVIRDDLVRIRRTIHQRPELGLEEHGTADFIEAELEKLGITERERHGTAVVALLRGAAEGPCVALRADIDALPVTEATGLSFSSLTPGKMHACGHDSHTAMALGAAQLLVITSYSIHYTKLYDLLRRLEEKFHGP